MVDLDTFNPVSKRLFTGDISDKGMTPTEFLERLAVISPDSVTLGERKPERNPVYQEYDKARNPKVTLPDSIEKMAEKSSSLSDFEAKLFQDPITVDDRKCIEENTRDQDGSTWNDQRKGRLTASKFSRIHTRMQTFNRDTSTDMTAVISEVLGYSTPPSQLKSLKYGRRNEPIARNAFEGVLKEKGHVNVRVHKCGLYVSESAPYVGATPDGVVYCDCCPKRILEIKCPSSCSDASPTETNVDCLEMTDQGLRLKRNHGYYTQVQGQMAVVGVSTAEFFVYSAYGYFHEQINFDEAFWLQVSLNLSNFFFTFVTTELIERKIKSQKLQTAAMSKTPDTVTGVNVGVRNRTKRPKQNVKKRVTRRQSKPVYNCGICKRRCVDLDEDVKNENGQENSVYCDTCTKWYHWVCVGILSEDDSDLEELEYSCPACKLVSLREG